MEQIDIRHRDWRAPRQDTPAQLVERARRGEKIALLVVGFAGGVLMGMLAAMI